MAWITVHLKASTTATVIRINTDQITTYRRYSDENASAWITFEKGHNVLCVETPDQLEQLIASATAYQSR